MLTAFRAAAARHGIPASTLTDNGMVFTTRFSGGKGGRNHLEHALRELSVIQKNGKPNHPQTQGKIETAGSVTLRAAGRLSHIGVGRTYARTGVILLVQDLHVTVVHAATGEVLRDLIIDPRRDYQPTGRPPGPALAKK